MPISPTYVTAGYPLCKPFVNSLYHELQRVLLDCPKWAEVPSDGHTAIQTRKRVYKLVCVYASAAELPSNGGCKQSLIHLAWLKTIPKNKKHKEFLLIPFQSRCKRYSFESRPLASGVWSHCPHTYIALAKTMHL
jgi:hypothetical protein